jgi:hypothetical protein
MYYKRVVLGKGMHLFPVLVKRLCIKELDAPLGRISLLSILISVNPEKQACFTCITQDIYQNLNYDSTQSINTLFYKIIVLV